MYNRRYDKVFLMLRQETAGYGKGQTTPWGSCVMELKNGKGAINVTAQGLRPLSRGQYSVYAILGENSGVQGFYCGKLQLDGNGRAELRWEFSPDGIEGSGVQAEELHTVAVLVENGQNGGGFSAPLAAYFGEKKEWKNYFKPVAQKQSKAVEKREETVLVAAEACVVEPPTEDIPATKERKEPAPKEESYHGSFQRLLEKFRQEMGELEETGVFTREECLQIQQAGEGGVREEKKDKEQHTAEEAEEYKEKNATMAEETAFSCMQEIFPFGLQEQPWKCIALEDLLLLEEIPLLWQKETFLLLPMRKYRHMICRKEGEAFWLGIPGEKSQENLFPKEMEPLEFKAIGKEDSGYWIWRKK